ncbi:Respiratory supercomplex factor 2 mitochondrial [Spathaspora sp. JA1]|nr:Respiratory supercomplex factor 2 mitochondrial [Spathaspora sp. JA1]
MKILTSEEKQAHISHVIAEGSKGLIYGAVLSAGIFTYLKKRHPIKFKKFNPSIKTCIVTMPTIAVGAFWADQGSWEFDQKMHQSDFQEAKLMEEFREWNSLSLSNKIFTVLSNNKYQIIIGAWAASLYGSWVFVNRDKIMSGTQKAVQARMYAQGITVILLLGTILLAMKEEEINKSKPAPIPRWKRIIMEKEAEEKQILQEFEAKKKQEAEAKAAEAKPVEA